MLTGSDKAGVAPAVLDLSSLPGKLSFLPQSAHAFAYPNQWACAEVSGQASLPESLEIQGLMSYYLAEEGKAKGTGLASQPIYSSANNGPMNCTEWCPLMQQSPTCGS